MKFIPEKYAEENGIDLGAYYYDTEAAEKVVRFIEKYCTHVKGELAGKPLLLEDFQKNDLLRPVFGWKKKADGTRKYSRVYQEIPRKNGKTTLIAAIAIYLLGADGELGAEVYSAAGDRGQAGIMLGIAKTMVSNKSELSEKYDSFKSRILYPKTASFYEAISSESRTKHGFNAHGILVDELHVQRTRDLWDTLTTSTGSRRQPLTVAITTAGEHKQGICWDQNQYSDKVLSGILKDDNFLPIIYAAKPEDHPYSPETWAKANPGYGRTVRESYFKQQIAKIAEDPGYLNTFKRLHLGIWTDALYSWIEDDVYMKSGQPFEVSDLLGQRCFGGLDLAATGDFSAFSLVFPSETGLRVLWWVWIPEAVFRRRVKDMPQMNAWKADGYLKVTEGEVVDYTVIEADIVSISKKFQVVSVAFDKWNALQTAVRLSNEAGLKMEEYAQNISSMNYPTKTLEKSIRSGDFHHNNNPLIRWMFSNVVAYYDANGNIKLKKDKSKDKIDGPIATVMAIGQWQATEANKQTASAYKSRGIISL